MADTQTENRVELIVRKGQVLVAVPDHEDGEEITRYYVETHEESSERDKLSRERALAAIGSWSDLDWEEVEDALYEIRHRNPPSPPLDLDDIP